MIIEDQIIGELKAFINKGNTEGFVEIWNEYYFETEYEREVAWDYIFQKVYLHAALKKQKGICTWLDSEFLKFNEITKIALRQLFPYAQHLLNK
jgi:hypothetical protein